MNEERSTSTLLEQTLALGEMLRDIAAEDPAAAPSEAAAAAFASWMAEAGPSSRHPEYFDDVLANYDILGNSNRDLSELFQMLQGHIELPDDDTSDNQQKAFIGLPVIGA